MDFGLHLQQDMACSTEQCTHVQDPKVSSEAEIGKPLFFPFSDCWVSETMGKENGQERKKQWLKFIFFACPQSAFSDKEVILLAEVDVSV